MLNFLKFTPLAIKLFPVITKSVHIVEEFSGKKGKDKEDIAVELMGIILSSIEDFKDKDLLNDIRFKEASRNVIKAYVSLMNVIRDIRE
jgi:hypothetical protein